MANCLTESDPDERNPPENKNSQEAHLSRLYRDFLLGRIEATYQAFGDVGKIGSA